MCACHRMEAIATAAGQGALPSGSECQGLGVSTSGWFSIDISTHTWELHQAGIGLQFTECPPSLSALPGRPY